MKKKIERMIRGWGGIALVLAAAFLACYRSPSHPWREWWAIVIALIIMIVILVITIKNEIDDEQ